MNKIFLFVALSFFAFNSKAQDLSFEETVKYIKGKVVNNDNQYIWGESGTSAGWNITNFEATVLGEITIQKNSGSGSKKFNLFDLKKGSVEGIIAYKNTVMLYTSESDFFFIDTQISDEKAKRLANALIHLRNLCTKEKDPFDK